MTGLCPAVDASEVLLISGPILFIYKKKLKQFRRKITVKISIVL